MQRADNTEYILSLSYGKDSLACLGAIELLGWPLDRIVHAEVWATDDIPADLPPMVDFKAKADAIILEKYGIEVEHYCAMKDGQKMTYERMFYHVPAKKFRGVRGFAAQGRPWCLSGLKQPAIRMAVSGGRGATADSSTERCGWPHMVGSWCKKLKPPYVRIPTDHRGMVQEAQAAGTTRPFHTCARAGREEKILSSISALQRMSRSA